MRFRIGKIGHTEVWLHGATLCCWLYLIAQGQGVLLGVGFLSIALHECAHGLVAALLHHPPQYAELSPLGLMLRVEEGAQLSAGQRAAVLLAGPCMSLLLALLGWYGTAGELLPPFLGARLFFGNLTLLLLNLLPALPLDGGRLLALLLSLRFPLAVQLRVMRIVGVVVGALLVGGGVVGAFILGAFNLSLCLVGCFLLYAACRCTTTEAMDTLRQWMDRRNLLEARGLLPGASLTVLDRTPLRQLLPSLPTGRFISVTVLESGTLRPLGTVTEQVLCEAYLRTPDAACDVLITA